PMTLPPNSAPPGAPVEADDCSGPLIPPVFDPAGRFGPEEAAPPLTIRLPRAAPAPAAAPPARAGTMPPPPPGAPTEVSVNLSTIFATASSMALTIDFLARRAVIVKAMVKPMAAKVTMIDTRPEEDR